MLIKAKGDTMYRLFFYLCHIMEVRASIVIMSHLSDLQENPTTNWWKINFVKYLVSKFPDTSVEIDADVEYEEFSKKFA